MNQENQLIEKSLKIGVCQVELSLGDFDANKQKVIDSIEKIKAENPDIIVFPECTLMGYYPADLLERKSIILDQLNVLKELEYYLKENLNPGIGIFIGGLSLNPSLKGKPFYNSAFFWNGSNFETVFHKTLLPTYDIFDEARHIEPNPLNYPQTLIWKGHTILVTICEDIWAWENLKGQSYYPENPLKHQKDSVDLIVNLSASPYWFNKQKTRLRVISETSQHFEAPMVYVNQIAGQDETVFDGSSVVTNKEGKPVWIGDLFKEEFKCFELDLLDKEKKQNLSKIDLPEVHIKPDTEEQLYEALKFGLKSYVHLAGFQKVHLGLSGGLDSALVAQLCVDTFGKENVTCLYMPSKFSSDLSDKIVKDLKNNLEFKYIEQSIQAIFEFYIGEVSTDIIPKAFGLTHENIQARIRANILMAYSNSNKSLLIGTSNKSELAVGYATLYGDLCSAYNPIGDLLKTQVFALSKFLMQEKQGLTSEVIKRPPSAELREGQKDEDSLPSYEELDAAIQKIIIKRQAANTEIEKWVLTKLYQTEFKRWQSPPILKVSQHAFGRGRRMPLNHKAKS